MSQGLQPSVRTNWTMVACAKVLGQRYLFPLTGLVVPYPSPLCMCLANHAARAGLAPDSEPPPVRAVPLSQVIRALVSL